MPDRTVVLYQIGSNAANETLYYEMARAEMEASQVRVQTFNPDQRREWIMEGIPVGGDTVVKVFDGEAFLDAMVTRYSTGSHMLVLDSKRGDEIPVSLL